MDNYEKGNPRDFTLLKRSTLGELKKGIFYETDWGNIRPGWHIECSVMVREILGDTIDIHAGGQDLTFPHHENEIAQSEAYTGKQFARYWMHNGYINIDNEKMSKSLGNFVLVNDIRKQIDPQVLRFFMMSVHYRNPINFSQELVENAKAGLERIRTSYANLAHRLEAAPELGDHADIWLHKIEEVKTQFVKSMDDDFNTANGIAALFELSSLANTYLMEAHTEAKVLENFMSTLKELAGVLGIEIDVQKEVLDEEIDALIEERIQARQNKDFARADEIRDQLKEMNILLEDTAQGIRWKRG